MYEHVRSVKRTPLLECGSRIVTGMDEERARRVGRIWLVFVVVSLLVLVFAIWATLPSGAD
jgi:hypothetical protein